MKKLKGFKYPTAAKWKKKKKKKKEITIFDQKQPFETYNVSMGPLDHVQFCLNVIIIPFRFLWMHFDHGKNRIQIFNFWPFL